MNIVNVEFSIIENLLAICFAVLLVGYLAWLLKEELKKHGKKSKKEVHAKVLSKFECNYYNQRAFAQTGKVELGLSEKGKLYKIVFEEMEGNNQKHEVLVSKSLYDRIEEGETAKVLYKGDELIQFGDFKNKFECDSTFVGINQDFESKK